MTRPSWRSSLLLAVAPSLCLSGGTGQPTTSAVPVRLEVTADQPLREAIRACLRQELTTEASTLVEQGTALTLAVIASEQRMSDGEMLGYLVYAGGYQPAQQCPSRVKGGEVAAVVIQWQVLRMVPPDLQAACQRIASEFISAVVEPTRREQERLRQQIKPARSKK